MAAIRRPGRVRDPSRRRTLAPSASDAVATRLATIGGATIAPLLVRLTRSPEYRRCDPLSRTGAIIPWGSGVDRVVPITVSLEFVRSVIRFITREVDVIEHG